jgi:hypothetical protein
VILDPHRDGDGLIDAVLIGRDFYKVSGPPPDDLPVPLEEFLIPKTEAYVSAALNAKHTIVIQGASWPRHRFQSMLYRENGKSSITVHHSLNHCYTRFAVATELGNVIMADNEAYSTTDIVAHLTGLLSGLVPERDTPLYGEGSLWRRVGIEHRHRAVDANASSQTNGPVYRVRTRRADDR